MRIFLAGATGAVGKPLVPMLVKAGHEVVGTTRSAGKADAVAEAGAEPVVLDALDRDAVMTAVAAARPDVVIHQLTAISAVDFKRFDESFAQTNELRTRGLDCLLDAARAAGAKRFIAQSFTGWPNEHAGSAVKTEDDPLDPNPARASVRSLAAIRHVEDEVAGADEFAGLALRFGWFYGPETGIGRGGEIVEMVTQRKFPIVGSGGGIFSFIHVADAASATLAAVERGASGVYNIVDDEPAPVSSWLPYLADLLGAKPPRRVPSWLARLMVGEFGVAMMTTMRGSSNAKAKDELGWTPTYPSWRDGFRADLSV